MTIKLISPETTHQPNAVPAAVDRRTVLKGMICASAAVALPALAAYPLPHGAHSTSGATKAPSDRQIEMQFVDSNSVDGFVVLGQVRLVNHSKVDITINAVTPGIIETENGRYNLSRYFMEQPIQVKAGKQHHFWVRPLDSLPDVNNGARMHGKLSTDLPQHESDARSRHMAGFVTTLAPTTLATLDIQSARSGAGSSKHQIALSLA